MVNVPRVRDSPYPVQVLRRYSGGGTVVVDQNTIFSTLIMNGSQVPGGVELFPVPLMRWSEGFFKPAFAPLGDGFALRENDFVFGHRKFGGNAQVRQTDEQKNEKGG